RRSNRLATSVIFSSRTTSARRAVEGPGMASASANKAWSSRWQKYCARNNSGRQMSFAPSRAAVRTISIPWSRFCSVEGTHDIWISATRYFTAALAEPPVGQFFGVVARLLLGLAEAVVLGKIAVGGAIRGDSNADGADYEPMGLTSGVLRNNCEHNLAGMQILQPLFAGNQLAVWRKDGRDP